MFSTSLLSEKELSTLPTRELCKKFHLLKFNGEKFIRNCSGDLQREFNNLGGASERLFLAVEVEESQRPEFTFDVDLYKERQRIELKLTTERKTHEKGAYLKDKKLNALDTELSGLHNVILEKAGNDIVTVLDTEVAGEQLHSKINLAKENLAVELEAENCLFKYLMPCFMSKGVKEARQALKRLEAKQAKLIFKDIVKNQKADAFSLEEKRETIIEARKKVWQQEPPQVDESLVQGAVKIDSFIEDAEHTYYTSVNRKTMFYILCAYESYLLFMSKLESEMTYQNAHVSSLLQAGMTDPVSDLNKLFLGQQASLQNLFADFWCPQSGNNKALIFHRIFSNLTESEKSLAFQGASELLEKLIPDDGLSKVTARFRA